ncbi:MAG: hypothetical protein NTY09_01145, partial [bacterium]|nr:hypothetical protein [bacterium]
MSTSTLRPFTQILILFFFVMLIFGCSSKGNNASPVLPDATPSPTEITGSTAAAGTNPHFCLLYSMIYFDVTDPGNPKYEIVPVRSGSFHLNILKFLEMGPCADCFKIVELHITQPGVLDVEIQIKHPFTDPGLSIFDVRGIVMFNGSHLFPESGLTVSDPAMGNGALLNAEGYTALYNGSTMGMAGPLVTYLPGKMSTFVIPNADVNGYLRHGTLSTRWLFSAGGTSNKTYTLKMPTSGQFALGYAVDASWAVPINQPVHDPVEDFGPDANCPEAWKIEVEDMGPGLTVEGGTTNLRIDVYDWQGKDWAHPVLVECPDLFDGEIKAICMLNDEGFSRYFAEIANIKLAGEGNHLCLIRKEAAENDPSSQPWLDQTAYQIINVLVEVDIPTPVDVTPPWLNFSPDDICIDGNYAYIACGVNGFHIFDISDPVNPIWMNWVDTPGEAVGVAVSGAYAYVADGESGLQIIYVGHPESAHIVGSVGTNVDSVALSGGYAYVAGGSQGFYIVDIDPPESAYIVNSVDTVVYPMCIAVSDGYAYVGLFQDGIQIIDVDPPESAHEVSSVYIPYEVETIEASGNYIYCGGYMKFFIVDVENPESPSIVSSIDGLFTVRDLTVSGGYAYITSSPGDFQIIDIDPPESAALVKSVDMPYNAFSVAESGGYAYVTDPYTGIYVIDIDPLESAYIVNSVDTPGYAQEVTVSGGYAYVADGWAGLMIIDIDPLKSAHIVSSINTPDYAYDVAVSGGYAYVTDGFSGPGGFLIIDIEPPESAHIVKAIESPGPVCGVAVSGGYAYVTDGFSG